MPATALISADEAMIETEVESCFAEECSPPTVRYEIVGPRGAPVVAVLGGISASSHVTSSVSDPSAGWWEDVVGRGRAIDAQRFRILCIDYVTHGTGTEPVTTNDQADALARALDLAGIRCLHAVVGASYGGMVALAFAVRYPERAKRLVVIGAAHVSDPLATALRNLQRRVVELGTAVGRERDGLAIARGIAITSYLTAQHFEERVIGSDRNDTRRVENRIGSYLRANGERFAEGWTSENTTRSRYLSIFTALNPRR